MNIHPPPQTARLQLANIVEADLDAMVALDSDPEVMRYLTGGTPNSRESYLGDGGLLDRMCRYQHQSLGYFSARYQGEFIGWFHLRPSAFDPEIPELGYRLARRVWRRGLATEGSLALCRWAFDVLGFEAVDACSDRENLGSIGVMRNCGMVHIASTKHPWADLDVQRYLVNRDAFRARF